MIPSPETCYREGTFSFDGRTRIVSVTETASSQFLAKHLQKRLRERTGIVAAVAVGGQAPPRGIQIKLHQRSTPDPEGFELFISPGRVTITGPYAGVLYGVETLCQLVRREGDTWHWRCQSIDDRPAMSWRGLMLDCSRHFLSRESVLRFIGLLPALRMNRLHLHLNDDQGWRMQIEGYPELTRTGAFVEGEKNRQGFYTQDDLREIVDYAAKRHVTVVPEIEIPGHAYAAMQSYPWLCCTGQPVRNAGHQMDLYCAGRESTFEFLFSVLREVMAVFPSPFIHLGGDEAPKDRWRACAACQQRIRQEELKDETALQGYMLDRCAAYLKEHGRQAIGWEEILDGNPELDTVVQWWRHRTHGDRALRHALTKGYSVISSPNSFCYLSFPVSPDRHFNADRTSDLQKVYSAELVPRNLPPEQRRKCLGAECCVWTEHLTEDDILPMLFPRILAAAELMWHATARRDYDTFLSSVLQQEVYWRCRGVNYGPYTNEQNDATGPPGVT